MNIILKTAIDVARIRRPSRVLESLFRDLKPLVVPGITPLDIQLFCESRISAVGAVSAQKGYRGFPASICACPNNVAAHGVPDARPLGRGDVLTIDLTLLMGGWHSDAAWTYAVGDPPVDVLSLIKAAWRVSLAGVLNIRAGKRLGDVGEAIQRAAKSLGCSVFDEFAGHGIGESIHEDPIVPNSGTRGVGQPIVPGMVVTVEPIVSFGLPHVRIMNDGWTAVTTDGAPTAQYEHTVAVFADRTEVLTLSADEIRRNIDAPPFF